MTYARKNILLLAGSILFFVVVYLLAIRNTLSLASECSSMEDSLMQAENAPAQTVLLQKRLAEIDRMIGSSRDTLSGTQEALLSAVTSYCQANNVILREFPRTVTASQNNYSIETHVFVAEGSFKTLLQMIYLLEQKHRIGKISSINFFTKKDIRTKTTSLLVSVYLQSVRKADIDD